MVFKMVLAIPVIGQVDYQETPTAESLRDAFLELFFMTEAPATPAADAGGIEFDDRRDIEWEDRDGIDFLDGV